jgi:hypothetical protein
VTIYKDAQIGTTGNSITIYELRKNNEVRKKKESDLILYITEAERKVQLYKSNINLKKGQKVYEKIITNKIY